MRYFHCSFDSFSSTQIHWWHIDIDIHAQHSVVLHLWLLRNHENILLGDQVLDAVGNLLWSLERLVHWCSCGIINLELLHNIVDDLALRDSFLSVSFSFPDGSDYQECDALIFLERNLDLLVRLALSLLVLLISLSFQVKEIFFSFFMAGFLVFVHRLLVVVKLKIILCQLDVGWLQEPAHFTDVACPDGGVSVEPCHCLGQSDQGFELSHSVPVWMRCISFAELSELLVFHL